MIQLSLKSVERVADAAASHWPYRIMVLAMMFLFGWLGNNGHVTMEKIAGTQVALQHQCAEEVAGATADARKKRDRAWKEALSPHF